MAPMHQHEGRHRTQRDRLEERVSSQMYIDIVSNIKLFGMYPLSRMLVFLAFIRLEVFGTE